MFLINLSKRFLVLLRDEKKYKHLESEVNKYKAEINLYR
jgi:hypothetical protein